MNRSNHFNIIIVIGVLFSIIFLSTTQTVWADKITVDPNEVNLIVVGEDVKSEIPLSFLISAESIDLTGIEVFPSSLVSENKGVHIDHEKITVENPKFDLNAGSKERIAINFDLKDVNPGKYTGKIIFANKESNAEIPVSISISSSSIIPLIPIGIGVGANFLIKYVKRIAAKKDMVKESFDEAESAYYDVKREGKFNRHVEEGMGHMGSAQTSLYAGSFDDAKKYAKEAKKSFEVAKTKPNESPSSVLQGPQGSMELDITPFVTGTTKSKDMLIFLGLSIIVGAAVLSVWTEFIGKFGPFGISYLDYISAFLYGFASQAVLGETFDLVKK